MAVWDRPKAHWLPGSKQVLGLTNTSGTYYFLKDLRGSIIKLTDNTGTVKNSYTYDPYGIRLSSTAPVSNPWSYAGGYRDEAGLYKFGARYYNSRDGRWTQLDPSGQDFGYL